MHAEPVIAVVGATGAVGREMLALLDEGRLPAAAVRLLGSVRSAGTAIPVLGSMRIVEEVGEHSFEGVDIALFSAGSGPSRQFAPIALRAGAWVIDNSSAFRADPRASLVIPEVNPEDLPDPTGPPAIVSIPNCSTIVMLMALEPLRRRFGVERIVVSTYQAVSGAGAAAMRELEEQTRRVQSGLAPTPGVFHEPCAFNLFSHDSAVDAATGRNAEERKMIEETRRIWRDDRVQVAPTCVRVPVLRAHTESIVVTLGRAASEAEVRSAFEEAPGVLIVDDRASNRFPTPLRATGRDEVLVGRIRPDETQPAESIGGTTRYCGYHLLACGDQLRKGAALNAVQIARHLLGLPTGGGRAVSAAST